MNETFLTYRDLAHRWKVSMVTIRRMVSAGQVPETRIGGSVRFSIADIERLEAGWKRTGVEGKREPA